jgi:hypothetical protein
MFTIPANVAHGFANAGAPTDISCATRSPRTTRPTSSELTSSGAQTGRPLRSALVCLEGGLVLQ